MAIHSTVRKKLPGPLRMKKFTYALDSIANSVFFGQFSGKIRSIADAAVRHHACGYVSG